MTVSGRKTERKAVTMRDVAKMANVSQSTVSRVLSGVEEPIAIGEQTRLRVMEAVAVLNYQPNLHAGSLRGQRTRMIAIMIADISNPFYHPLVRAVQDVANAHRYDVMIANSDHTLEGENHFVDSVLRRPVDGMVIVPYHLGDAELDDLIERTGAVITAVGQHLTHPQVDIAYGDDGRATCEVVTWLRQEKGHDRIGFIGVTDQYPAGRRRRKAYEEAHTAAGIAYDERYELLGDWSPESGFAAMNQLLALTEPPTAVFACNDLMAVGALEAIKQSGRRTPEDVAVVGFDDIPAASWISPTLSSIAQNPRRMGEILTQQIFERIAGNYGGTGRRTEVPLRFMEREST